MRKRGRCQWVRIEALEKALLERREVRAWVSWFSALVASRAVLVLSDFHWMSLWGSRTSPTERSENWGIGETEASAERWLLLYPQGALNRFEKKTSPDVQVIIPLVMEPKEPKELLALSYPENL